MKTPVFRRIFKRILISSLAGVLAGLGSAIFLYFLSLCTEARVSYPRIVCFLPLAGFFIGFAYWRWAKTAVKGIGLVVNEIQEPQGEVPLRMAPMVLIGTLVTHLFGGSAGREGTAVQMGAALAEQIKKWIPFDPEDRQIALMAGMAAGFGSAIGTPWAGGIFGVEVVGLKAGKWGKLPYCLISSFIAMGVTILVHAPHTHYPNIFLPAFSLGLLPIAAATGVVFGFAARAFIQMTRIVEHVQAVLVKPPWLRPFIGGLILVYCYKELSLDSYAGLSLPLIQGALEFPPPAGMFVIKAGLTALTIGSGFKGGEFIPLVLVGTALGSFFGQWLPLGFPLAGALGFAAVFGGAAATPLAAAVMAGEIFGLRVFPYSWVACLFSALVAGSRTVYVLDPLKCQKWRLVLEPYQTIIKSLRR